MFSSEYIRQLFQKFSELTVTVAGDVMADQYIEGQVNRISPEAPVPVVEVQKKHSRPGGAGNVAVNLIALGAKVNLCSVIGNDHSGKNLLEKLNQANINTKFTSQSSERSTTTKTRIIGNHIQMLRMDEEQTHYLSQTEEKAALALLETAISESDALLFQDYDKGYLSPTLIAQATVWAKSKNIPITVDPKLRGFFSYPGVTLFKPNLKELKAGLQRNIQPTQQNELKAASISLREKLMHEHTFITLSEFGVFGESESEDFIYPAYLRNIADVSGAGDTVIAVVTLCLAAGADFKLSVALANLAGGMVCEKPGVVPVDKEKLVEEALKHLSA